MCDYLQDEDQKKIGIEKHIFEEQIQLQRDLQQSTTKVESRESTETILRDFTTTFRRRFCKKSGLLLWLFGGLEHSTMKLDGCYSVGHPHSVNKTISPVKSLLINHENVQKCDDCFCSVDRCFTPYSPFRLSNDRQFKN